MNPENLGPAEKIIQTLLTYTDHLYHGRPGVVAPDQRFHAGVRWEAVTTKIEAGVTNVYKLVKGQAPKKGKAKTTRVPLGVLQPDGKTIKNATGGNAGEFRPAGLFPEVAAWMYTQVAEVFKLDNEFAARWASFAFGEDHKDLKVVLAAFMLVQNRKGDPVLDDGKLAFHDDDFRDVGEAMLLTYKKDGKDLNPRLMLRMRELLVLPQIAAINRQLHFGQSARKPFLGRWPRVVTRWLQHREENPKLLDGLVKAGFRSTVIALAKHVGYKPISRAFFETLKWEQAQAKDGRRTIAIGETFEPSATWEGLTEAMICERVVAEKPNWKRLVGLLPRAVGVTRAIVAAAIESGAFSTKDLIIATPTLEELGLLQVPNIKARWEAAVKQADDTRAANIAANVKTKEVKDKLIEAADTATQKAIAEVMRDMRVYLFVDISGSMTQSIELAKTYLSKFVQGFPLDRLHVATFTTTGREITIKHASAAGVKNAFQGVTASGGTAHASGVRALAKHKPQATEDSLFIFVGDEGETATFEAEVRASGLRPTAFGLVRVPGENGRCVVNTAARLAIPCFLIDNATFDDAYAIPRTLRNLIAATPVGVVAAPAAPARARLTLVEQIVKTPLLPRPAWAVI